MKLLPTLADDISSQSRGTEKTTSGRSSAPPPGRPIQLRPESRDVHFSENSILASDEESLRTPPARPMSRMICARKQELADQQKVVYRQFGRQACDVLELAHGDGLPIPPNRSYVVIKVEVRVKNLSSLLT